jgi:hypothetical protein
MLEKKDTEIRMLQDIVKQLQRDGKTVGHSAFGFPLPARFHAIRFGG